MTILRALEKSGIAEFSNYLDVLRSGDNASPPIERLSKEPYSTQFYPAINIDDVQFLTRFDLGKYLNKVFNAVDRKKIINNSGVWSWLSLMFFAQLCPTESDGSRKVRERSRYICSNDYTDYYRHLIVSTYEIYHLHQDYSRLFLTCPLYIHNDFIEQVASRQDIITNHSLIKAIDSLYWRTSAAGRTGPKKNSTNRKVRGSLRRLLALVNQLDLTYDLYSMSKDDILSVLPNEFNSWKSL